MLQTVDRTPAVPGSMDITDAEAQALARTTINLFAKWDLSDEQACILLGEMSRRTWARWKAGSIGSISRDLRSRMAILMGIHKGLRYLFTEPQRGYDWIKKPNSVLGGASALEVMLQGEMTDLIDIRDYLAAERGL